MPNVLKVDRLIRQCVTTHGEFDCLTSISVQKCVIKPWSPGLWCKNARI